MEKKEIINLIHDICFEMMDSIDAEEVSFHDDLVLQINKKICEEIDRRWDDTAIWSGLEQESRKGHWIELPHEWGDNWQYSQYECSCCHNWAHFDTDYWPNCGAKMEEGGSQVAECFDCPKCGCQNIVNIKEK